MASLVASNQFTLDISKFVEQVKGDITDVVRKTAFDLFSTIIMTTPVDTSRAMNAWFCTVGGPSTQVSTSLDKSGAAAVEKMRAAANSAGPGDSIWLSNNVSYIVYLEFGTSKMRPVAMVGRAVANAQSYFDKAAKSTKSFA